MPRFTLRSLFLFVSLLGLGIGLLRGCYVHFTHFETAENVPHVNWLPRTASNISYYRSYRFTAYEFDISEPEFKKWTWLPIQPITQPMQIDRYKRMTRRDPEPAPNAKYEEHEAWEAVERPTISDGLYYDERSGSSGGVSVAYDRALGRAFFQSNPR